MILTHDKIEYIITDTHSDNDGITCAYLQVGLNNQLKNILNQQIHRIKVVSTNDIEDLSVTNIESIKNQEDIFSWDYCEHLYLQRAYQKFTQKMKRVFDGYYIHGISAASLAEQENCSVRSIYGRLQRCRESIFLQKSMEVSHNATKDNH